ncbi:MAG: hypothetical protein LBS33_01395, partial [Streptococcaceae bacterium]|nr:hypothetical protein [Streptococcaceae bacterium]
MKVMYGDFTANLTQALVQQAEIALKNKRKVFYLVPSFMSVDLESEILELLTIHSQIDLQVLSFKRFAWYFLKNNALFKTPQLTEVGKAMLFRKVLTELKEEDELVIFKGEVHQIGFLEQLVNFSNEMSESLIKPSDLSGSIKLDELAKIMMRYQESLKGQFREEDIIEVFINQISQGELTLPNQALIILEGFSVLTAKERQLIEILEKKGYEIIFGTFISEKAMNCQTIIGNVYEAPRNFLAKFNIQQDKILVNEDTKIDKELTKLSKYWEEINEWHFQPSLLTLPDNATIEIWKTLNMVEEVKAVAKKIRFLVANGVDYQNIQVLCGNLADYNGIIQPIFDKQEIYYYFDDEVKQVNHLLVEFVESLINLEKYNYRYEDIMRLLRTELLPVNFLESDLLISDEEERFCNRRLIDNFELFLLEKGINSRSALEEKFIFEASSQEEIKKKRVEFEKIQQIFIGKQSPIAQFIDSSSFTKFRDVLEFIQPQFSKVVKLSTSQDEMNQHREAWNTLMSLLQEYHAIYQDDDRYFSEMLVSGLKNAVFRKIPASINLVQIKSYELSRPNTSDYVFAIGLIENNFPKKDIKPTILSEEERIHVNEVSKNGKLLLIKTETTSQAMFTASQVFASARKKLFLSSPRIYLDEAKEPSRFLKRLVEELGIKYTVKEIVQINHIDLDQIGSY